MFREYGDGRSSISEQSELGYSLDQFPAIYQDPSARIQRGHGETTLTIYQRSLKLSHGDRARPICINRSEPLPKLWVCIVGGS